VQGQGGMPPAAHHTSTLTLSHDSPPVTSYENSPNKIKNAFTYLILTPKQEEASSTKIVDETNQVASRKL